MLGESSGAGLDAEAEVDSLFVPGVGVEVIGSSPVELVPLTKLSTNEQAKRDGTKAGYDLELLRGVVGAVEIPVIASGGVGTLEHLREGLAEGGADAALAASIFHDGMYTVQQAKGYLGTHGVLVRGGNA